MRLFLGRPQACEQAVERGHVQHQHAEQQGDGEQAHQRVAQCPHGGVFLRALVDGPGAVAEQGVEVLVALEAETQGAERDSLRVRALKCTHQMAGRIGHVTFNDDP